MKGWVFATSLLAGLLALGQVTPADEGAMQIQSADTVKSVLERSAGQTVGVRLGSGEELRGKVGRVGDHLVQLSELSGREFFDAIVPLDAIQAVVIKARSN